MNGDIAHRSIRSSMSRMVEARLPRMISSVTGSTGRTGLVPAGIGTSGMGALQEDVMGVIDAGPEAGRDENGRVVLIHDGRAGERHAGGEAGAEIGRHGGGAAAAKVHAAVAGDRVPRFG